MHRSRRLHASLRYVARALVIFIGILLIAVGIAVAALETGWAKNQIRALIVRQANEYLTAQLEIGELAGSLFRGIQLGDIRLSKDGHPLISIDNISLSYSMRELLQPGVVIKQITVVRPRIAASRGADGRWDLSALVKREAREEERTGPGRPIEIIAIDVRDATVTLSGDVAFGAAHIPTRYAKLDASFSFRYAPVRWALDFTRVSFLGTEPELTMNRLSGGLENGPAGLVFKTFNVVTPRSTFTLAGRIDKGDKPTSLDLQVSAPRFAFQEWGGIIRGLRNIAVEAQFDTTLRGPLTALATDLGFQSDAGAIRGSFVLNTTVPGWLGKGAVTVTRIDLARWLSKPDKVSDITGRVAFDLAFGFGEHFPRGTYTFDGPHAMFMHYAGDNIRARGVLNAEAALITEMTALAYGAQVRMSDGSIDLSEPFRYHFPGAVTSIDLRRLPPPIPVPHVESTLTFDYDVTGTFTNPFIAGQARFARSTFLGARIGDGLIGTIDTSVKPITYGGDGEIDDIELGRFGEGLDVGWMRDPRYAGTIDGRFQVQGSGTDRTSLRLTGGGRLHRANMLGGRLSDADVTIDIADGTLRASYDGTLESIDPAIALADRRFDASLTGIARVGVGVRELLLRSPQAADYDIDGTATLRSSRIRDVAINTAEVVGTFRDGLATLRHVRAAGPAFSLSGAGSIATACVADDPACRTELTYDVAGADLERLRPIIGGSLTGLVDTKGRLTGSIEQPRVAGEATLSQFTAPELEAATVGGTYDVTLTSRRFETTTAQAELRGSFLKISGVSLNQGTATLALADGRVNLVLCLEDPRGRSGVVTADALVTPDRREATLQGLSVTLGAGPWRLVPGGMPPVVSWKDDELSIGAISFVGPTPDERIGVAGTWRSDGRGALRVTASRVSLDALQGLSEAPARYGGVLNADATLRGTRRRPIVTGTVEVTAGRVRRFSYERLAGRVDYSEGDFSVDLRLDQGPGVFLTAVGTVPAGLFDPGLPERNIDVAIKSSPIGLGLVEGLTNVVRDVSGQMQFDVKAVGTSRDPHFEGSIEVGGAAFLVPATNVRYKNGRTMLSLASDRLNVDTLHIEDPSGRALELHGSLGTHEMRVGDVAVDATARRFQVVNNEFGKVEIDADLRVRGRFESPEVVGDLTIASGTLHVDEILDRTLLRPYATEPLDVTDLDAIAALNPWDRLGLDVSLHIPQELKLVGDDLQVAQGTPIGLGDVNLRVGGDLYLYKSPNGVLSMTGSLDRIAGTYAFQGRRFDIDESRSSINFLGDVNPEMYVTVTRIISGVEARVTVVGDLHNPELRLSSTPPLEPSDILGLIVFNSNANDLTAPQQQELAVRAATIAAGFFAKPLVSAIERSLGLDILEIETNEGGTRGTRVTVGQEIAPGLLARFSRQFGQDEFDEATVEYSLSRLLRIRATFSDATSATIRSPFRRVERAGIDLLLFFSF